MTEVNWLILKVVTQHYILFGLVLIAEVMFQNWKLFKANIREHYVKIIGAIILVLIFWLPLMVGNKFYRIWNFFKKRRVSS